MPFPFLRRPKAPAKPPLQRTLDVAGRILPLTVTENRKATRLTLRIEPGGRGLKMTVPHGMSRRDVDDFLERHHGWLMTRLAKFPKRPQLAEGYSILIRGKPHRIERTGKLRGLTEAIMVDGEAVLRVSGDEDHLKRRIRDYLKAEALKALTPLVESHGKTLGRKHAGLSLKDTRSRWGSCSAAGNLSFSWRIIMAPDHVIDYLAAHEVSHLAEMNHSPAFWALCEKLCPRTDEARAWLKRNGSMLHAIDFS